MRLIQPNWIIPSISDSKIVHSFEAVTSKHQDRYRENNGEICLMRFMRFPFVVFNTVGVKYLLYGKALIQVSGKSALDVFLLSPEPAEYRDIISNILQLSSLHHLAISFSLMILDTLASGLQTR